MKKVFLVFLVFGIIPDLTAQKQNKLDTLNFDQIILYRHKAAAMRNAGIILTLGGAGIVLTTSIIANLPEERNPDTPGDPAHDGISIWTIFFADMAGISCTLAGIPLWTIGGIKKSKAEIALKKFNIVPGNSMALGLGITIRF